MTNFIKYILAVTLFFTLAGCEIIFEKSPRGWPAFEPRPLVGVKHFPPTDTDYGKGFRGGCGAAWDAVTKGLTSDVNPKAIDTQKMVKSPDYALGWSDGFEQCTYIVDWDVV